MNDAVTLHVGDCLDVLTAMAPESADAIVTDPPYELGFMGRAWDASGIAYNVEVWRQCLRVLKPGGHLLAFGGTRTYHRLTCAIEDAGFEVRDSLHWITAQGFPKSLDVGKAIDKAAGATREVVGPKVYADGTAGHWTAADTYAQDSHTKSLNGASKSITAPATDDARRWQGWGTALKPAHEPVVLARKPLSGTVAATVLAHGTGGLNIDGCRVGTHSQGPGTTPHSSVNGQRSSMAGPMNRIEYDGSKGRWPANVLLTHPPAVDAAGAVTGDACADGCVDGCPVAEMDAQSGVTRSRRGTRPPSYGATPGVHEGWRRPAHADYRDKPGAGFNDAGGASRFFPTFRYQAKAPKAERPRLADGTTHPTVKPVALMRWLVRLVTPPGGLVLDPFAGSGTTGEAAALEGMRAALVEQDETHVELIRVRLAKDTAA